MSTTYYFDSVNGSDGANGTSTSTPKKNYDTFRDNGGGTPGGSPGDTFLFKRGTTQVITTDDLDAVPGSSDMIRTRFGAYGEAQVPYSKWTRPTSGTLNNTFILNVSAKSYIDFEDMCFDGLGTAQYSLYMFAAGSTPCVNNRITRCLFTNMGTNASGAGQPGLNFGSTDMSTGDASGHIITDSLFFNNKGHGMLINGAHDVIIRRCSFFNNGTISGSAGTHGFSSKFRTTTTVDADWTQKSMGSIIWKHTLAAWETDVYYFKTGILARPKLIRTANVDQTSPSVGEFGVSAGVLYVNENDSGRSPGYYKPVYAWGRCYNLTVENCESYGNSKGGVAGEGHGFAFDDFVEQSTFRLNRSHNNEGAGFSINLGNDNIVGGNLAYRNDLAAVTCSSGQNTIITSNTFLTNNLGGSPNDGEIYVVNKAAVEITNNFLRSRFPTSLYAVDNDADPDTIVSGEKNSAYGYDTIVHNGSALSDTVRAIQGWQGLLCQSMV